jgi:flagellar basal body-associated protein FliL
MKHSKKHRAAHSGKGRKKAFIMLIILGVIVMCVYFLALQDSSDTDLVEETNPELNEVGND